MAPSKNRIALNVNGPIWDMPKRCATKAKPQMMAVINNSKSALKPLWFPFNLFLPDMPDHFSGDMPL